MDENEKIWLEVMEGVKFHYTSCKELHNVRCNNVIFLPHTELSDGLASWVDKKLIERHSRNTPSELKFKRMLQETSVAFDEEVFFHIDGFNYFLDFFIPECMIAFEIDGGVHKHWRKEGEDINRDVMFRDIGITTLRYTNTQLTLPNIREIINKDFRAALKGEHNILRYFNTCNTNKHELKETVNQRLLKEMNEVVSALPDGCSVCIETNLLYFLDVLDNRDYSAKKTRWQNYELIEEFYKMMEDNNVKWVVRYIGNNKKIEQRCLVASKDFSYTYKIEAFTDRPFEIV